MSTIPKQGGTWERRCGRLPWFSKCQWPRWRRWSWPGWLPSALCQSWMGRSSCCSCPGKKKNINRKATTWSSLSSTAVYNCPRRIRRCNLKFGHSWGKNKINVFKRKMLSLLHLFLRKCHRCSMSMHWPSLQVNSPSEQVVNLIDFTWWYNQERRHVSCIITYIRSGLSRSSTWSTSPGVDNFKIWWLHLVYNQDII